MDKISKIKIYETRREIGKLEKTPLHIMTDVTNDILTSYPGSELEFEPRTNRELRPATDAREVFVVHGRNLAVRDALFTFLRSMRLDPLEWSEAVQATGKTLPYTGEILDAAFSRAHAVVVLFTPDDEARLREPFRNASDPPHEVDLTGQARPNVLFEAGMAMGRSEDRTVLVELGTLRPFTDIGGRHTIRLDNTTQRRQELAQRLEAAGCPVNREGTDWHTAGDFEAAMASMDQGSTERNGDVEQRSAKLLISQLSPEAVILLTKAANDRDHMISRHAEMNSCIIIIDDEVLNIPENAQSVAIWESALNDLVARGLVEDSLSNRTTFALTRKGIEVAEKFKDSLQPNV